MTEATPDPIESDLTEEITTNGDETKERFRGILRMVFAVLLGVLIVGDMTLYSLYKAMDSHVESQERRMDRMNKMLNDSLTSHENAEKIAGLETQVDALVNAVGVLQQMVEDTRPLHSPKE